MIAEFENTIVSQEPKSMEVMGEKREIAEVQASFVIAKRFMRNQMESYRLIMENCRRPSLAEQAMYAYPRGGALVTGPSIRLAESMAQSWGNLECGVREIYQNGGVSIAEAYAIDLQTNTRVTKTFHVKHERHTKKGVQRLSDPRDVYELVANQGARRLRACILAILPGDIVESAVECCKKTMESSEVPISERIKKMVVLFDEVGVKVEHLEKKLGHNLDAIIPTELVNLTAIYKSLKDGMGSRESFFDIGLKETQVSKNLDNLIEEKQKIQPKAESPGVLPTPINNTDLLLKLNDIIKENDIGPGTISKWLMDFKVKKLDDLSSQNITDLLLNSQNLMGKNKWVF